MKKTLVGIYISLVVFMLAGCVDKNRTAAVINNDSITECISEEATDADKQINIMIYEEIYNLLQSEAACLDDEGNRVAMAEYKGNPAKVVGQKDSQYIVVTFKHPNGGNGKYIYDSATGQRDSELIEFEDGTYYLREDVPCGYRIIDTSKCVYMEYDGSHKMTVVANFKIIDGKAYVLSGTTFEGKNITVTYYESNPTIMSELLLEGEDYLCCKWNEEGNEVENLTFYEYHSADESVNRVYYNEMKLSELPIVPKYANDYFSEIILHKNIMY